MGRDNEPFDEKELRSFIYVSQSNIISYPVSGNPIGRLNVPSIGISSSDGSMKLPSDTLGEWRKLASGRMASIIFSSLRRKSLIVEAN